MDALVWVDQYQVQSFGEPFALGQHVTWPITTQLNVAALTELVGAVTAARISMAADWHAGRPEDTVSHTGTIAGIELFRCRHARGHVVPNTVETHLVDRADGWEPEKDGVHNVGYLVTLTNVVQALDKR